jgi:hypothetical protein
MSPQIPPMDAAVIGHLIAALHGQERATRELMQAVHELADEVRWLRGAEPRGAREAPLATEDAAMGSLGR